MHPWMIWVVVLVPVGYFILLFLVALLERTLVRPYVAGTGEN